jgi:hypothetical protein
MYPVSTSAVRTPDDAPRLDAPAAAEEPDVLGGLRLGRAAPAARLALARREQARGNAAVRAGRVHARALVEHAERGDGGHAQEQRARAADAPLPEHDARVRDLRVPASCS